MQHFKTPEQNLATHIEQIETPVHTPRGYAGENQWEPEIRKFERNDARQMPPRDAVLFVGSSSIALWQNLAEDFAGIETIRRGFGGSTLADANYFYDRIVAKYQPRAIVLYDAGNDLASGKTPRDIAADFEEFVASTRDKLPGVPVFYLSAKIEPARMEDRESVLQTNALIHSFCERDNNAHFIDVMSVLLNPDGHPNRSLFEADGIHINRRGYEAWANVVKPRLQKVLTAD